MFNVRFFLSRKYAHSTCYQRNSTVQKEGLFNEARHHLLLLHKQAHDKRSIAES